MQVKYLYIRKDGTCSLPDTVGPSKETYVLSIAINPKAGNPAISYGDGDQKLHYAYRDGPRWNNETVDAERNLGGYSSLAFGPDGTAYIGYNSGLHYSNLMVATRNPYGSWSREKDDRGVGEGIGNTEYDPALKVTDQGIYIAHRDGNELGTLRLTRKLTAESGWTSVSVDKGGILGNTGDWPNVLIQKNGNRYIIYYNHDSRKIEHRSYEARTGRLLHTQAYDLYPHPGPIPTPSGDPEELRFSLISCLSAATYWDAVRGEVIVSCYMKEDFQDEGRPSNYSLVYPTNKDPGTSEQIDTYTPPPPGCGADGYNRRVNVDSHGRSHIVYLDQKDHSLKHAVKIKTDPVIGFSAEPSP